MDNDTIKTYSYRISQATRSQLVVITYDITLEYLNEAVIMAIKVEPQDSKSDISDKCKDRTRGVISDKNINTGNMEEYYTAIRMAMRGIDQLITGLDMNYEVSVQLYQLYNYMKRTLISASASLDADKLQSVIGMLVKLRTSFLEVSRQDDSQPLMKNTEKVYAGLTYSRYGANETAQDTLGNRGYKV